VRHIAPPRYHLEWLIRQALQEQSVNERRGPRDKAPQPQEVLRVTD
jgi:hypothetical protein